MLLCPALLIQQTPPLNLTKSKLVFNGHCQRSNGNLFSVNVFTHAKSTWVLWISFLISKWDSSLPKLMIRGQIFKFIRVYIGAEKLLFRETEWNGASFDELSMNEEFKQVNFESVSIGFSCWAKPFETHKIVSGRHCHWQGYRVIVAFYILLR